MAFTCVVMASAADRSGGDVAIPISAGETSVSGNGVPGTGTQWYPPFSGHITAAVCNSETGAAADARFRKTTDPNYNHLTATHLQTDTVRSQVLNFLSYPVGTGDAIEAQATTAGAQLDVLALYLSNDNKRPITIDPPSDVPSGAMIVEATGATTFQPGETSFPLLNS